MFEKYKSIFFFQNFSGNLKNFDTISHLQQTTKMRKFKFFYCTTLATPAFFFNYRFKNYPYDDIPNADM